MPEEIKKKLSVSGTVDTVIYQSEESGYTVLMLDSEGECITVVGTMPGIRENEMMTAWGEFVSHPTYGEQFKAEYFERVMPETKTEILRYLSSGAIKGIGPKTAARIVGQFGEDTFDVLENHPEWLAEINGISAKKAAVMSESFRESAGARDVIMFCRNLCSGETAMKIYKKWGHDSVGRIRENPYRLCREFSGIGFRRADEIALAIGFAADDASRLEAGVNHVLGGLIQKTGNTLIGEDELTGEVAEVLGIESAKAAEAIRDAVVSRRAVCVEVGDARFITTEAIDRAEKYAAGKLSLLMKMCAVTSFEDTALLIKKCEVDCGIEYAAMQKEAIYSVLTSGVSVITGGPGTGKTTIVRALITIFDSLGMKTVLAAPTGRAAKRMSEATAEEAKTIHRLLEMEYSGDDEKAVFLRDEKNLLDENVIIIDEASMVDIHLLDALLRAVKPGARLILIGDADQLPPVGAGNVLADVIRSDAFPVVRLTEIFRQSGESMIVTNAHRINDGVLPDVSRKDSDFFFLPRNGDAACAATVADLIANRLPAAYGEDFAKGIQVITPSRKGECGTAELNRRLQYILNPPAAEKAEKSFGEKVIREGDRVMQTRNNYEIEWVRDGHDGVGIFNGDIGTVTAVDHEGGFFEIDFDERVCEYDFAMAEDLEHAYAITVHKSQGSEYPAVVIPLYRCAPMLLTRNLLYTAITRAERMVILVGSREVLETMVANDRKSERLTDFCRKLVAAVS